MTLDFRRCDHPDCPGFSRTIEMHEIESGPQLHDFCLSLIGVVVD